MMQESYLANTPETITELDSKVPELPNFITFLHHHFPDVAWIKYLHQWENLFFSILIAVLVSLIAYIGVRKRQMLPTGLQNFIELGVEKFENLIVEVLGPDGRTFVPFLGTLFIYILTMNLFGLIPLMKSPSSNLNITIALAICVFTLVQFLNIKNMGIFGFVYHLAGSPKTIVEWILAPFLLMLELISQLARPITLALRLFGNVLGEDILIGTFALLGVTLVMNYSSMGIPLQVPFMFLALLTSTMQALVFTLLSTVYILLSSSHKEKH
ncbi:MAG TPA: F0F1 ATP synthase subunit A [Parachlamydiaceae bacterium]|nr:F0F1 ATP synthase subunit A [Parachlamydiaceae bacterium]